jgi:hypothetical protein
MASNKELTDQIISVAAELGKTPVTDGLNNGALASLLSQLNEEKAAKAGSGSESVVNPPPAGSAAGSAELAAAKIRAEEAAAANKLREEAAKAEAAGTSEWVVADGVSVSCLRGNVDAGKPLSASDFARGDLDIQDLANRVPPAVVKRA